MSKCRLAPLGLRREIGILGFLHRVNLGLAQPQICELFQVVGSRVRPRFNLRTDFHNKQLFDRVDASSTQQFRRSIFGIVGCYNALPQRIVDYQTVKQFQSALQAAVVRQISANNAGWREIYSTGRQYGSIRRFQRFFE